MPPIPIQPDQNPIENIIEAGVIQGQEMIEQGKETNTLLEALVLTNKENNIEPLMEAQIVQSEKNTKVLKEAIGESNKNTLNLQLEGVDLAEIKGDKGDTGEKGEKGDTGETGEKGDQGERGEKGLMGKQGFKGEKGDKGDKGDQGPAGKDGIDGTNGKDGLKGNDGSPDTPEQIKSKLEKLKGDKRLDIKSIKGIEKLEKDIARGGGVTHTEYDINDVKVAQGTRLNLKNGTNTTITGVATSNGIDVTINATGGGGSGDVTGPATNTDGYIPQWDGADSKTLKNGIPTSTFAPALGADDNYVTDAEKIVIGNTSGTNSGDNATNTQYSGLAASKQDTLVSGTSIKTINSTSLLGSGDIVVSGADEKVKYDAGDSTAGYVADKIVAGTGISVAEGTGANENKLVITNSNPTAYTLPTAAADTLGGVKVGTGLSIDGSGVLSASGTTATPYAETPSGTINSSNVTFTLANTPASTDGVIVVLDGVVQYNGVDYTVSGTTITFGTAPVTGSTIYAYYNTITGSTASSILSVGRPGTSKTNSTASGQDFTALYTIPANTFIANKVLRVTINCRIETGTSTVTVKGYLKLGTTKIIETGSGVNVGDGLDVNQSVQFLLVGTDAPGASVGVEGMSVGSTVPGGALGAGTMNNIAQPVAVATNGTLALTYGVAWSGTGSTETITILSYLIEALN